MQVLKESGYTITHDWTGSIFCGITLNWDYVNGTVDLSMPGYVEKALNRFAHHSQNQRTPRTMLSPSFMAQKPNAQKTMTHPIH